MKSKILAKRITAVMFSAVLLTGCGTPAPTAPVVTNTPPLTATPTLSADAGNIKGRLTYKASGKSASGFSIGLGTTTEYITGSDLKHFVAQSWTKTDTNGYFTLYNVKTGKWIVGVNDPLQWTVFPWENVSINPGATVTVELKVVDRDLRLISPSNKSVLDTRKLTLRWMPYSGAVSYWVRLYYLSDDGKTRDVFQNALPLDKSWIAAHKFIPFSDSNKDPGRTTGTEISLLGDLPSG
jgi:hypothetical protein